LINNPTKALEVANSAKVLAIYFKDKNINTYCNNQDWATVRKLVNGGLNRWSEFKIVVDQFIKVSK